MTVEEPTPAVSTPVPGQPEMAKPRSRSRRRLGRIVAIVALLLACAGATWYWAIYEPEPKDDLGRFQGDWKLISGARDENEGDDRLPPKVVRIAGDRLKFLMGGKEGKTFRIELNETASPKEIELTLLDAHGNPAGGYRSRGIYTIDRHIARLILEPVNKPRPRDFNDPDSVVWELSRVKLTMPAEPGK